LPIVFGVCSSITTVTRLESRLTLSQFTTYTVGVQAGGGVLQPPDSGKTVFSAIATFFGQQPAAKMKNELFVDEEMMMMKKCCIW